jgi:hypothetical protein
MTTIIITVINVNDEMGGQCSTNRGKEERV